MVELAGNPNISDEKRKISALRPSENGQLQSNNVVRLNSGDNRNSEETGSIPTAEIYGGMQYAFDFFNAALFDNSLKKPVLTLVRKRQVLGYFWQNKFENIDGDITHEISINPRYLEAQADKEVLSTLVHEMVHLFRHQHGALNRKGTTGTNGYHDLVWAAKMDAIGLQPTNNGAPDGKRTGRRVTHIIIEGGPFDSACNILLSSGFRFNWHGADILSPSTNKNPNDPSQPNKKNKLKFTCAVCGLNAWAKPTALFTCSQCIQPMCPNLS